ncbi:MAG TPA: hypothetical protein VM939_15015 [Gemmatimonadaceae bacterium]|nr:hypothetical protein [Gemmatimonadaceae bacterium]
MSLRLRTPIVSAALAALIACGGPDVIDPNQIDLGIPSLRVEGRGVVNDRYTGELWIHGNTGYTTTWSTRTFNGVQAIGNAIKIWNVGGADPVLVDSLLVPGVATLGDAQVTSDGKYLVVATEPAGSLLIYGLQNPRAPTLITRYTSASIAGGVHTAEVQPVGGRLYAFLSVDPRGGARSKLVILDITTPTAVTEAFVREIGGPVIHDVFVRDGILMAALWDDGMTIFDIGGGGKGGTPSNPVQLGNVKTVGGNAHNIYWFHDPRLALKRFAFVGEEGPGSGVGGSTSGDLHVVDVSDMTNPREVAFLNVPGAGAHNFSADEENGILYAAFYNGGVRVVDARGDLSTCAADQKSSDGRCDLAKMNRQIAVALLDVGRPVAIWGVQFTAGRLYASDMLNGLWRIAPASGP